MLGLRTKLSLGFGGLLVIIAVIGIQSVFLLSELGESIDIILRENYRSVIAAQEMKEALERMDSGALFTLLGYEKEGKDLVTSNDSKFRSALQVELNNITLPGEAEKAALLQKLFSAYKVDIDVVTDSSKPRDERREHYFGRLLPLFEQIKQTADEILTMNQENMSEANQRARVTAAGARHRMYILLLAGAGIAAGFVFFTGRWIVRPIARLQRSADEISRGNLDLVVQKDSDDEIGGLSESFNTMAESLREFRRSGQARLVRIQRSTQEAFDNLPEAIAVVDAEGSVEVATGAAVSIFSLKPGRSVRNAALDSLDNLLGDCILNGRTVEPATDQALIQKFIGGEERYYRPKAVPILEPGGNVTGVVLILSDVTRQREQDELKRSVISTVSHQLKTPLTSIRMALHLLLEEKLGSLTEKQLDVLIAAREDAEKLHNILEDLLDISRLESGKLLTECCPAVQTHILVLDAVEPYSRTAQDKGVGLNVELPNDLPNVRADQMEVNHVFANLLSNALAYTAPGGTITVSAKAEERFVRFFVSDSGVGIPDEYREKVFDQFFRVPGQESRSGAGLGLSIARKIVEAHGGLIKADNREGGGSVFHFTLPRADVSEKG
ncbi:MAG: ATP-binding protein [Thermodesulfobacteriota bacterium]